MTRENTTASADQGKPSLRLLSAGGLTFEGLLALFEGLTGRKVEGAELAEARALWSAELSDRTPPTV
jgi:hypothetical protein